MIVILAIVLILGLTFALGGAGLLYKKTITKEGINIDREIFEKSKSYIKGISDDLAKYQYELTTTEDEKARKAICKLIITRCADLDINDLNSPDLRKFLNDVRTGKIK